MGNLTVFLQLDACRKDYMNREQTPFLHSLAKEGISGSLVPTFGFEPDAAYIAGLYPDQVDGGAQFWHDPSKSPFKYIPLLKCLNYLPRFPELVFRKLLIKSIMQFCKSPSLSLARVPFHLLRYFSFPMEVGMAHPDFCSTSTVFDQLRGAGKSWLFHCHPNQRVDLDTVVSRAEADLQSPLSFAFFHIGNLDTIGHSYGPISPEMKNELRKVDEGVKKILQVAKERFDEVHFLVIGDHGMMTIDQTINVWKMLDALPLKLEKDYLCFLDSTMARFWFFSKSSREMIVAELEKLDGGHILNKEEIDRYHLNYSHSKFGELIYLADPRVLIFPNYYQKDQPGKGMHGYAPETSEQQSLLMLYSPRVGGMVGSKKNPIDMRQVFPTVLDLLNLPIPKTCDLKSLVGTHALYN